MRDVRHVTERFLDVIRHHLTPALAALGFERRRGNLARDVGDIVHIVEVELAPWTTRERIAFTLTWGVDVPMIDRVLDDPGRPSRVETSLITGRLGADANGLDGRWFTVGPALVVPLAALADRRTGGALARDALGDVVPALDWFDSVAAVQAHLVVGLRRGRGAPDGNELRRIRWIAGLSLILGERENASRWLDYLEARSSSTIAPDVVAARLAGLRLRCAS